MLAVLTGEVIWVLLFGGLGAVFAGSWEALSALAGDVAGLVLGGVIAAFGLWRLWAARRARRSP